MSNFDFSTSFDCFTDVHLDSATISKRIKFAKSVANTPLSGYSTKLWGLRHKFCRKVMMNELNYMRRDLS